MRKVYPPKKIDAGRECFEKNLFGMERKLQTRFQEQRYPRNESFQIAPVFMQENEIIGVSYIVFYLQLSFQKLIKLVHINIHEELACEIPEWQTNAWFAFRMEAIDDFIQKPKRIVTSDAPPQDIFQYSVINARKELLDIAFQNPCGS